MPDEAITTIALYIIMIIFWHSACKSSSAKATFSVERKEDGIMKTALTIAGSDCSGGAGIQADLKTMTAYGVYGMSVITALTAQNTLGVTQNNLINADVVSAQLMSVLSDITPNAIKIGMLGNGQIATAVAEILQDFFSPSTHHLLPCKLTKMLFPSLPSHLMQILSPS